MNEEALLKKLTEEPNNAELYQELGKLYIREKKTDEAKRVLLKSLELDCNDGWTFLFLGNVSYSGEQYETALRYFEQALESLSDIATPYWCMAEAYEKLNQYDKAHEFYQTAVKKDPSDEDAIRRLKEWNEWYVRH